MAAERDLLRWQHDQRNPHRPGKEPEEEPCLRCGKPTLDTGWECTECGWDGINVYGPIENLSP